MDLLDLTDPRWNSLKRTYMDGPSIAKQLAGLEAGSLSASEEGQLWQQLCHQYSSTESGYAAVPHLIQAARVAKERRALELLSVAAHVVACGQLNRSDRIPDFLVLQTF